MEETLRIIASFVIAKERIEPLCRARQEELEDSWKNTSAITSEECGTPDT